MVGSRREKQKWKMIVINNPECLQTGLKSRVKRLLQWPPPQSPSPMKKAGSRHDFATEMTVIVLSHFNHRLPISPQKWKFCSSFYDHKGSELRLLVVCCGHCAKESSFEAQFSHKDILSTLLNLVFYNSWQQWLNTMGNWYPCINKQSKTKALSLFCRRLSFMPQISIVLWVRWYFSGNWWGTAWWTL